jgi:integrase/recombinase XerD
MNGNGTALAMTRDQVLALLTTAKCHSRRAHAMCLLAIRHGMRCSEVTGLRLDQVNVREGWIRVERLKGSLCTQQALERHPGSPLLDEVKVLSAWLRERRDDGTPIMFNSTHGGRMDRSTFFRLWRKLAEQAGLPEHLRHTHVAKHTAGTLLAAANANVHIIRQHLGHRALSSAAIYCQVVSDSDADAVAKRVWMETF